MTRTGIRHLCFIVFLACLGLIFAACSAEPLPDIAPEVAIEPQRSAVPAEEIVEASPTDVLETPPSYSTSDDEQDFGPIVGPKYTQPPTATPRPTDPPPTQPGSVYTTPLSVDQTRLDPAQMGIQAHYNFDRDDWEQTLHRINQLRVGWIKLQAAWEWLQPDLAGQFDQNFRLFQLHVQKADQWGYQIMLSIAKAPDWARHTDRSEDGPPDDLNQLVAFIRMLLDKLGPQIDAIEIWNEPNLRREWTGSRPLGGASYMELFRVAYDTIRAHSPHITVVTAGLAPTGNHSGVSVDDRAFLHQMYGAGLGRYNDVKIGVHPYSWGNPPDFLCCDNVDGQGWDDQPQFFFQQTIRDYAGIIAAYGDNAQMWVSEFGWATWEDYPTEAPEVWMAYNSAQDQKDYTLRAFQIGQTRADVGVMILWNLSYAEELTISRRSELAAYSLLYAQFNGNERKRERPLYFALAHRP